MRFAHYYVFLLLYIVSQISNKFIQHLANEPSVLVYNDNIKIQTTEKNLNPDEYPFNGVFRDVEGLFKVINDEIEPLNVTKLESNVGALWPHGIVTYEIFHDVEQKARRHIKEAFNHIERYSCIQFQEFDPIKHPDHGAYIIFKNGPICASLIGYHKSKTSKPFRQVLFVSDLCPYGSVLHEILHALGFHHEERRAPRVRSSINHISDKYPYDIRKVPYDLGSIMHGSQGKVNEKDEFRKFLMGQRNGLSFLDHQKINYAYRCSQKCAPIKCQNQGYVGKDCKCACPFGFEGSDCSVVSSKNLNFFEQTVDAVFQTDKLQREIVLISKPNRKLIYELLPIEMPHDSEEEELHPLVHKKEADGMPKTSCKKLKNIKTDKDKKNSVECEEDENNPFMIYLHILPEFEIQSTPSKPTKESTKVPTRTDDVLQTDENNDIQQENINDKVCDVNENTTYFRDSYRFLLDQNHVLFGATETNNILQCTFGRYFNICPTKKCPILEMNGWCHYKPFIENEEKLTDIEKTDKAGYVYSKSKHFEEKPFGTLKLGPVDISTLNNPCLTFWYTQQGNGTGGITLNFINDLDLRYSRNFGWQNLGRKWHRMKVPISFSQLAMDKLIIEFIAFPDWDGRSLVSVDSVHINECTNESCNVAALLELQNNTENTMIL